MSKTNNLKEPQLRLFFYISLQNEKSKKILRKDS